MTPITALKVGAVTVCAIYWLVAYKKHWFYLGPWALCHPEAMFLASLCVSIPTMLFIPSDPGRNKGRNVYGVMYAKALVYTGFILLGFVLTIGTVVTIFAL